MSGQVQVASVRVCPHAPCKRSCRPYGTWRFLYGGLRVNQLEHVVHDRGRGRCSTRPEPLDRPSYGGGVLLTVMELGYGTYQAGGLTTLPSLARGSAGGSVNYLAQRCLSE